MFIKFYALCRFFLHFRFPIGAAVGNDLSQEAHGDCNKGIYYGVLLDEYGGKADHHGCKYDECLKPRRNLLFLQPSGGNSDGIAHVQGGTYVGVGINGVELAYHPGEYVIVFKYLGAQILAVGIEDVNGHGHHLRYDNKGHKLLKAAGVVECKVEKRSCNQKIPEGVGNNEILTEGNQIVKRAVDYVTNVVRDKSLGDKVEGKVTHPAKQVEQVIEFGLS